MTNAKQRVRETTTTFTKLLPILSFIIPFLILYSFYQASFESTWKGRMYYLFFLWLISLETILSWEQLKTEKRKLKSIRTILIIITLMLPTIYVVATHYSRLNIIITDLAVKSNIKQDWANLMPLSIEYLVFTVLLVLILLTEYGISSLQEYSISTLFLGLVGMIYITDNLYPFGNFTPFQFLVPITAKLAAGTLNLLGYQTLWLGMRYGMPTLIAMDQKGACSPALAIAWPCSGIESLLIYSVTILLFLKKTAIPWKQKIIYFTIGAIVTYSINILRIVTIFILAIYKGDWGRFHDLYGQLYSITWIISYPLIIIGSRALWRKIRCKENATQDASA